MAAAQNCNLCCHRLKYSTARDGQITLLTDINQACISPNKFTNFDIDTLLYLWRSDMLWLHAYKRLYTNLIKLWLKLVRIKVFHNNAHKCETLSKTGVKVLWTAEITAPQINQFDVRVWERTSKFLRCLRMFWKCRSFKEAVYSRAMHKHNPWMLSA